MKTLMTVSILLTLAIATFAQAPDTLWTRTYGVADRAELVYSIRPTADGGYMLAGAEVSAVRWCYLLRVDSVGNEIWHRTYGEGFQSEAHDVTVLPDGGFAIAGWTSAYQGEGRHPYVVRTNSNGDALWTRPFRLGGSQEIGSITPTQDGGFLLIGGYSDPPTLLVLKITGQGDTVWTRFYEGGEGSSGMSTADGGCIATGSTHLSGAGGEDAWLVKLDSDGYENWARTFGGTDHEHGTSVEVTADGGYILCGQTDANTMNSDMYVVKVTEGGDMMWSRNYDIAGHDYAYSIRELPSADCVVAGWSQPTGGPFRVSLLRIGQSGDSLWSREYGCDDSYAFSIVADNDSTYLVAGYTHGCGAGGWDAYLLKVGAMTPIMIISPNGGETWALWDSVQVRWKGTGFTGNVMIELTRNYPDGPWDTLAYDTPNDSTESVFVTEPISDLCRVRVSALEDVYTDISDGNFSIVPSQGYLALIRAPQPNNAVLAWNAGTIECPQTVEETFNLKNFGDEVITVYRAEDLLGTAFSRITNCPLSFTLAAGEISACDILLNYAPVEDVTHRDTLRIHTNASNGVNGYVRIPLSGTQIRTPQTPTVVISTEGENAILNWNAITQSLGGCDVNITRYLVFFAEESEGPFWYHGFTADTSYTHVGAISYASGMFYHLTATTASPQMLEEIPPGGTVGEEEVIARLR